jgi:transcriptional regulator with XRE-family HTH domain
LEVVNKTSKYQKSIFVKNLISGRKKLGMSAEEFAEFADIKYQTLRDIEHGSSPGSARTKEKIAQALGTTVDNLNIPAVAPATSERADTILAALTLLQGLDDVKLRDVFSLIERVAGGKAMAEPRDVVSTKLKRQGE